MRKLLKYELKQTWGMAMTLIGVTLLACIALLLNPFTINSVVFPLYIILCGLIIGGSTIYLFFYCMGSFNQVFTQPQGYLTMTLPVKTRDFIWAKFINQGIWNILSTRVIVGTFTLLFQRQIGLQSIGQEMNLGILRHSMLNGIVTYILNVFIIYFSIVLFSRQPTDNHGNFMKIIVSIIISYSANIIIGIVAVFVPYSLKYGIPTSIDQLEQIAYYVERNIGIVNGFYIVITLIMAGVFYFVTEALIDKKVQI